MNSTPVRTNLTVAGRHVMRAFLSFSMIWRVFILAVAGMFLSMVLAPNLTFPAIIVGVVTAIIGIRKVRRS